MDSRLTQVFDSNSIQPIEGTPFQSGSFNGVDLYYQPESDLWGISVSGLAKLLDYEEGYLYKELSEIPPSCPKYYNDSDYREFWSFENCVKEVKALSNGGLQEIFLIPEHKLFFTLEAIKLWTYSRRIRTNALILQAKFAKAGCKLTALCWKPVFDGA
jgi:hypothetical protein